MSLPDPYYKLRWRFDYADKPCKCGIWSMDAPDLQQKAALQSKEGLIKASVEAKNVRTYEITTLAECAGQDFANFQWMAEFRGNTQGQGYHRHTGLQLVTRDDWISVYFDGRIITTPRTEEDKNYHYASFGR